MDPNPRTATNICPLTGDNAHECGCRECRAWRNARGPATPTGRSNQYDGSCGACGTSVPGGSGHLVRETSSAWGVRCRAHPPAGVATSTPASPKRRRVSVYVDGRRVVGELVTYNGRTKIAILEDGKTSPTWFSQRGRPQITYLGD